MASQSTKAHTGKTDVAAQEMRDQHDPFVRARRLQAFLSATADKVWCQLDNGEWTLVNPMLSEFPESVASMAQI